LKTGECVGSVLPPSQLSPRLVVKMGSKAILDPQAYLVRNVLK
jgi:hypothetical protein